MSDKLRETDEEDFWRGAYESLNKKKLREDIINALHSQHLHIDSRELGIVMDVVHAREKAHGWNIEQILVYIWQCESGEQTAEEYPYQRFRDSEMGQRLRRELAALAGAASVGAGETLDFSNPLVAEAWQAGFELAHELQPCGHSRGDCRDDKYIPGVSVECNSVCIGCERERALGTASASEAVSEEDLLRIADKHCMFHRPTTEKDWLFHECSQCEKTVGAIKEALGATSKPAGEPQP